MLLLTFSEGFRPHAGHVLLLIDHAGHHSGGDGTYERQRGGKFSHHFRTLGGLGFWQSVEAFRQGFPNCAGFLFSELPVWAFEGTHACKNGRREHGGLPD